MAVPVITSGNGATAAYSIIENNAYAATIVASGGSIVWSISGGADELLFAIDSSTGVLTFVAPPDYETPTDGDEDNVYVVEVTATNGDGSDVQTVSVTITNDVRYSVTWGTVSRVIPASNAADAWAGFCDDGMYSRPEVYRFVSKHARTVAEM